MTKSELITILKPFTDDIEILIEDKNGFQRPVVAYKYVLNKEGRIVLCPS